VNLHDTVRWDMAISGSLIQLTQTISQERDAADTKVENHSKEMHIAD
jgi:hypothetical protein